MSYTRHTHFIHTSYTCHTHVIHVSYTCPTHVMSYTCHTHDQCARFPIQIGMTGAGPPPGRRCRRAATPAAALSEHVPDTRRCAHGQVLGRELLYMSFTCHTHVLYTSYTCHTHVIHESYTCHTHVIHMSLILPMAQRHCPARELVRMAEGLAEGAARDHAGRLAPFVDERDLVVVVLPVLVRRMAVVTRVRVGRIGHDHWPAPIEEQVLGVRSHVAPPD